MTILFVVESPGKIEKISKILGKQYRVAASMGHFRDLDPKKMSIDFANHYAPIYIITKPDTVGRLKKLMKSCETLYIASDLDMEGESIAQHIYDVLRPKNYKRVVFNAITKSAILDAIGNAGKINKNLVDAQKTRRILDRIYGYSISPVLQKRIGGKLSAGRVQSVATRIIIDRENEISSFLEENQDATYFRGYGTFSSLRMNLYQTDKPSDDKYSGKIANIAYSKNHRESKKFLKKCQESNFYVHSVTEKESIRHPPPPFETSTLQQEANRKFGMSVDVTMKIAQKLYEGGFITYMRTDSVEISEEGHQDLKKVIIDHFGKKYYQRNNYPNKSKSSQEAHEAIRPTHPELMEIDPQLGNLQVKLYQLIWQRTIASQMKPAKYLVSTIQIEISEFLESNPVYYFQSNLEKNIFKGYTIVYQESSDKEDDLPQEYPEKIPQIGKRVRMESIILRQEYHKPPVRYSEASFVKTLKKMGIGRPSTYVNTIKTIINRGYVSVGDVSGFTKEVVQLSIEKKKEEIIKETKEIVIGGEKKKIIPTELGITVNQFLLENFTDLLDYEFTSRMESELDKIANGEKKWLAVVKKYHQKLEPIIEKVSQEVQHREEKRIGVDDEGVEYFLTRTKYGPAVKKMVGGKPIYANTQSKSLTLEEAISLFEYPKYLGKYQKKEISLKKGRYGFYLDWAGQYYAVTTASLKLEDAIRVIEEKQNKIQQELVITHNGKKHSVKSLKGKFGPYICVTCRKIKKNYPIPKKYQEDELTEEIVLEIINTPRKKFSGSKKRR